jgi:hypothetical protein
LLSSAPAIVEASGHSKRYEIWKQCYGLQSDCFTVGDGEADQAINKVGVVQQVKLALVKCHDLCGDAGHEVIRRGECGDKIQEMKKEFAGMIDIAAKLRSSLRRAKSGSLSAMNKLRVCLRSKHNKNHLKRGTPASQPLP